MLLSAKLSADDDNDDERRYGNYNKHEWVISAHILKLQGGGDDGLVVALCCEIMLLPEVIDWIINENTRPARNFNS